MDNDYLEHIAMRVVRMFKYLSDFIEPNKKDFLEYLRKHIKDEKLSYRELYTKIKDLAIKFVEEKSKGKKRDEI